MAKYYTKKRAIIEYFNYLEEKSNFSLVDNLSIEELGNIYKQCGDNLMLKKNLKFWDYTIFIMEALGKYYNFWTFEKFKGFNYYAYETSEYSKYLDNLATHEKKGDIFNMSYYERKTKKGAKSDK